MTMKVAMLGGLAAIALVLVACGGGGSGSVKYAPTVVSIRHLDFSGIELSVQQFQHPPFAGQYPAVVATVNGQPVTGEELAREEVSLELSKRSYAATTAGLPDPVLQAHIAGVVSTDPLEAAIDVQLKKQAIDRLGLLPSHDEAVQYTRDQKDTIEKGLAVATPERREQEMSMMRAEGFPASDWASSDSIVSFYAQMMAQIRLGGVCKDYKGHTPEPTLGFENVRISSSCDGFLANERKHADIVYYVRWAD